jgi:hypothetical protein
MLEQELNRQLHISVVEDVGALSSDSPQNIKHPSLT